MQELWNPYRRKAIFSASLLRFSGNPSELHGTSHAVAVWFKLGPAVYRQKPKRLEAKPWPLVLGEGQLHGISRIATQLTFRRLKHSEERWKQVVLGGLASPREKNEKTHKTLLFPAAPLNSSRIEGQSVGLALPSVKWFHQSWYQAPNSRCQALLPTDPSGRGFGLEKDIQNPR